MNVLLVQPPDPAEMPPQVALSGETPVFLSPPWELLCLRAYVLEHTRHQASLIDCRVFNNVEAGLREAIKAAREPRILVVNAVSHALGRTAAVLEMAKRDFPEMTTVLCGEFPSEFPEHVYSIPRVDYALSGDPEPILRNLLDYMDVEPRLRRVPGLVFHDGPRTEPYWLPKLHALALPDWSEIVWTAYQAGWPATPSRVRARISRGHTRLPADRAFGDAQEPLRIWPLDRMAGAIQKCASLGISQVFLSDPPGVWTPERLRQWCTALNRIRNTQPWGIQLLPTMLEEDTVALMAQTMCRRVDFVFPSCDPMILVKYGCVIGPHDLTHTVKDLDAVGIRAHARFWLGGPEERKGESKRVARMIHDLSFIDASLHPFPFSMDCPLYEEVSQSSEIPHLEDWIRWSRDPWTASRPVPLWRGQRGFGELAAAYAQIQRSTAFSPRRFLKWVAEHLRPRTWLDTLGHRAIGLSPPASRREL